MGFLNALIGNSSEVAPEELQREYAVLLLTDERVLKGYKLIRDVFLFTDRRLLLIDKQGLTGKKIEYQSIPYRSIVRFAVETAGTFDLDAELRIWVASTPEPVSKQFTKQVNVYEVQAMLAEMVCGGDAARRTVSARVAVESAPMAAVATALAPPPPPMFPTTHAQPPRVEEPVLQVAASTDDEAQAKAMFEQARLQVKQGNEDAVMQTLREIVRRFPSTRAADHARKSLRDRAPAN